MKKTSLLFSIAACVFAAIVSCNKETESTLVNEKPSVQSITFALAGDPATKSILAEEGGNFFGRWQSGDKLGSITTKSNGYSAIDVSTTPVTFSVYSSGGLEEGNTINLWYPYLTTQTDPTSVALSIPTTQIQYGTNLDFSAMPMVAEQITVTAGMASATNNTAVDVVGFYNLGSVVDFCIYTGSSYTTEKVISVNFTSTSNIGGDFTKDLTAIDATDESTLAISGLDANSVTTELYANATAGASSSAPLHVYMVIAPGNYTGTVKVTTDVADYTWTIGDALAFARSGIRSLGLKLDKASATRTLRGTIKGNYTFDLTKVTYSSASETAASWGHGILTIDAAKGSASTATNSYMPPAQTSTRFYSNSSLTFTPSTVQIAKVVFEATTDSYATAIKNSTWNNASASKDGTTVTIVPTNGATAFSANPITGTAGASAIRVYYDNTDYIISKGAVTNGTISVVGNITSAKVNTTINLSATPASGYDFTSWSVIDGESNPVPVDGDSFQMPASNVTVSATFTAASAAKTISITAPSHGTVTTSPAGSASPGATVTITATPDSGYGVNTVSVVDEDSTPIAVANNQFTMPDKDVTVTVTFIRTYVLVTDNSYGGSNNGYANLYDVTCDGIQWKGPGNQTLGAYWQIGGFKKSNKSDPNVTGDRFIYGQGESTIGFNVATIKIFTNGVNNTKITVNSITVTAHASADDAASGSNVVATFTTSDALTFAESTDKTITFTKSGSTDCTSKFYRIAFNLTNTDTKNHGLKVTSISFTE